MTSYVSGNDRRSPVRVPTPVANSLPLLIAAFCVLWSSAFAVAKLALLDCPPLLLVTVRFLVAGGLTLAVAALQPAPWRLSRREVAVFAVLGIANNALYLGFNHLGMETISAGLTALIASANPVLTALLAAVFLGEPMSWRKAAGLLLGIGGVGFIVESRIAGGSDAPIGIAFAVVGLVSLVGGTILFKRLAPNGGIFIGSGIQNLAGGLALAPFAFAFESVGEVAPTWRLLGALAYLVLLVSVLAYPLWLHLLTVIGATGASAYHFLMPPLGLLFGWLLLGEHVVLRDLVGLLPITLGIYLVTRPTGSAGWLGRRQSGRQAEADCRCTARQTV